MSTITKDLGVVTAYGYAVSKGYEGTEEEFAELMASYATVAEQAAQSAETAEEAAEAAAQAVLDANAAKTAAQAAQSAAESASTTAQVAATSASNSASSATSSASTASTAATTATEKATEAAASATAAAGSATAAETAQEAAEDAQAAAEAAVSSLADFAPTVVNTASGDVASFTDGADDYPVKDLLVDIDPVQDLHGYANPWPGGGGKNLIPFPYNENSGTISGVSFTVNDDGTVNVSGTASATVFFNLRDRTHPFALNAGTYAINGAISGAYIIIGNATTNTAVGTSYGNNGVFTIEEDIEAFAFIQVTNGQSPNGTVKPMLRLSSITDDTFAPYSNICPITGWTGAIVTRTGKNLLDVSESESGGIDASGNSVSGEQVWRATTLITARPNTNYVFKAFNWPNLVMRVYYYDANKTFMYRISSEFTSILSFTTPSNCYYMKWSLYKSTTSDAFTPESVADAQLQIELGSTATSYEPYNGDTYAVTFPTEAGTVYSGTLDVTTGVLTVDNGFVDMGTLNWQGLEESGSTIFNAPVVGKVELRTSALICSQYKPDYTVHTWADLENGEITGGGNNNVYIRDIRYSTVADFKTAMDGVQLVYELATPVTYQCTPTEVKTLLGANNIFADTGAVDVEYCADTKKYIDNAIAAAVASLS